MYGALLRSVGARWGLYGGGVAWRGMATKTREWSSSQAGVLEFFDRGGGAGSGPAGRAWSCSEMRLKSVEELRQLWFVLLKEKTILMTERDWCRTNGRFWEGGRDKMWKVKMSMARLKTVMGERIRLYNRAKRFCQKNYEYLELLREGRKYDENYYPFRDEVLEEIIRWEFSQIGKKRRHRILTLQAEKDQRLERVKMRDRQAWLLRKRAWAEESEEDDGDEHPMVQAMNYRDGIRDQGHRDDEEEDEEDEEDGPVPQA